MPTPDHRLSDADENVHSDWDRDREPIRTVAPGEVVRFECRDSTNGQLTLESTAEDVLHIDRDPIHPLTGPVAVEGAEPGDTLVVEILSIDHKGKGFTYVYPGDREMGLLPEEFADPYLHVWDLEGGVGHFVDDIEVPLAPFPGNLGVAPASAGPHSTTPPRRVGGNLDNKHLTAGSRLYLPVEVAGGLFSIGDGHAAQGDGEVCVTAIETPIFATVRLDVRSDLDVSAPQFETAGPFTAPEGGAAYATTGVADDLMDASKDAIRGMIDHLHDERGLSRRDAYALCSVAADLKVSEVVNAPNWVVTAYLPEAVFPG